MFRVSRLMVKMYKLFLCFRYLTRKGIVVFPILVVWLCVMMMIIVASIMGGFVDRVREANRGLMGDIVIFSHSGAGWPYYEELQNALARQVPEVELSTPVVHSFGLFSLPGGSAFAQVVGIKPDDRAKISDFKSSLYLQDAAPRNAVADLSRGGFPVTTQQIRARGVQGMNEAEHHLDQMAAEAAAMQMAAEAAAIPGVDLYHSRGTTLWLLASVAAALGTVFLLLGFFTRRGRKLCVLAGLTLLLGAGWAALSGFTTYRAMERFRDRRNEAIATLERAYTTGSLVETLPLGRTYASRAALAAALVPAVPSFDVPKSYSEAAGKPLDGCIIGVDLGDLIPRDSKGNYDRSQFHYPRAVVTVVPVSGRGNPLVSQAREHSFVVVDDSYTKVYDVDSTYVYVPFEIAQDMAGMQPVDEDGHPLPRRCTELQLKIRGGDDPDKLLAVRDKIQAVVNRIVDTHPDIPALHVQTWDQKQAKYIGAVRNEKTMMTVILGLMSIVVVVVIFLIFYMIVRDKTRDIGIIKALGGSEEGVAGIFLFYGLFIGTVGGVLGGITGTLFVWNTNWIHDSFLYDIFGVTIWDRSVYLFDRIPDRVNPVEVAAYVIAAILAGAIGALIPAVLAGLQDPVKAVRYE